VRRIAGSPDREGRRGEVNHEPFEGFALDQLHHQIIRPDVVQRANVRMVQRGDGPSFPRSPGKKAARLTLSHRYSLSTVGKPASSRRERTSRRDAPFWTISALGISTRSSPYGAWTKALTSPAAVLRSSSQAPETLGSSSSAADASCAKHQGSRDHSSTIFSSTIRIQLRPS